MYICTYVYPSLAVSLQNADLAALNTSLRPPSKADIRKALLNYCRARSLSVPGTPCVMRLASAWMCDATHCSVPRNGKEPRGFGATSELEVPIFPSGIVQRSQVAVRRVLLTQLTLQMGLSNLHHS